MQYKYIVCFVTLGLMHSVAGTKTIAQATIDFKVEYKHGQSYTQTLENHTHTVATYTGNSKRINELKSKGMKNPTVSDKQLLLKCTTRCRLAPDKGRMGITMQFAKAMGNVMRLPKSYNALIYLHKYIAKEPVVDSINMKMTPAEYKSQWLPMIQTMLGQMVFPARKINVGVAIREQSAIRLPIAGKTYDIVVTTTYTLKRATADSAWFDMAQVFALKPGAKDVRAIVSGTGAGKMVYDVKNNYITRKETASDMTLKITQGNVNVESVEHNVVRETIKMGN